MESENLMENEFEQLKFFAHCEICKRSFGGASQDEAQARVEEHWTEKHHGACEFCEKRAATMPASDPYWAPTDTWICEPCAERAGE